MAESKALKVIDQVVGHFEQSGSRVVEVPEWGDENGPLVIHATAFTMEEQRRLRSRNKGDLDDPSVLVDLLILKALDADGSKLFDLSDKPTLMRKADANVLARVAADITGAADTEDAAKN